MAQNHRAPKTMTTLKDTLRWCVSAQAWKDKAK